MSLAHLKFVCSLIASPGPKEVRVAVVPIIIGASLTPSAVALAVAEGASLRPGVRVLPLDEYFMKDGGEIANRVRACGSDTACIAEELPSLQAELGLVVVAVLDLTPPLLTTIVVDARLRSMLDQSHQRAGGKIEDTIRSASSAVFDRLGFPLHARLVVSVQPAEAAIRVDSGMPPDLGAHNMFTVLPGTHTITATSADHSGVTLEIGAIAGHTHQIPIVLDPSVPIWKSPWLWIGVGAAVVGGAVAIGVTLGLERDRCVCIGASCSMCR